MAKQAKNGNNSSAELPSQLGQLRDILFGEDKREFEANFDNIEQSTVAKIEQLTQYINQEINTLRDDMDKQFQLLSNQLNDSDHLHSEREDQLQEYAESTQNQLVSFEKSTQNAALALEKTLNNDNKSLNMLLTEHFNDLTEKLAQLGSSLSHSKTDRELLAQVLTQAAAQISQPSPSPSIIELNE